MAGALVLARLLPTFSRYKTPAAPDAAAEPAGVPQPLSAEIGPAGLAVHFELPGAAPSV